MWRGNRPEFTKEKGAISFLKPYELSEKCEGYQQISILDLLYGKTSPEHSAVTREPISRQSLRRYAESKNRMFLFLNLRGGWKPAGLIVGDGYSIAWRVYDAQYWGVPQRRKRIYLVADFGSERAGEILFESESLQGDPEPGSETREETAANAGGSTGRSCNAWSLKGNFIDRETKQNGMDGGRTYAIRWMPQIGTGLSIRKKVRTLTARMDSSPCVDRGQNVVVTTYVPEGNHCGAYREDETSATLQTKYHYGNGGDAALVVENHPQDSRVGFAKDNVVPTLNAKMGTGGGNVPMIIEAVSIGNGQLHQMSMEPVARPLDCMHDQQAIIQEAKPPRKYIVRRLTPLECCRLQGFPDWWCENVEGSDSAQYKMWGNGIALPCAVDVLGRIRKAIEQERRTSE